MLRQTSLVLLFWISLVGFSFSTMLAQENDKAAPSDLDRVQGSWQMILRERGGQLSDIGAIFTIVEGDQFRTIDGSGKQLDAGTISLGQEGNSKTYDAKLKANEGGEEKTYPGIYRLQGDTWQTCVNGDPNGTRPVHFYSEPGTKVQMIVWRRVGTLSDLPEKPKK